MRLGAPYRDDIDIKQYAQDAPGEDANDTPARQITCLECFPTRVKLIGDLDATASDINIQEIECAVEEVALTANA